MIQIVERIELKRSFRCYSFVALIFTTRRVRIRVFLHNVKRYDE